MKRTPIHLRAVVLAPLVASLLGAAPGWAGPDDREVKQARKDLKKNARRLVRVTERLDSLVETLRSTSYKKEDRIRQLRDQVDEMRGMGLELISAVGLADEEDAAEFLTEFGVTVRDEELYQQAFRNLEGMRDEEAIEWMVDTLVGDLEDDRRRRRRDDDETWKARVMIAEAFGEMFDDEEINGALALVIERGTKPAVVNTAVKSVAGHSDKRIISALIALLGRVEEQGGWEYYRVRQALVDQTGEDFYTHEKWSEWWGAEEPGWDYEQKGEETEADRTRTRERGGGEAEEEIPTFFGSEIESNRVVFIIDTSGSMKMTDRPGDHDLDEDAFRAADPDSPEIRPLARIERAKAETIKAISALQPTQRFNVIAYSGGNRKWRERMVDADAANKEEATAFVEGLRADGGTYTDDAIKAAFEDPDVDTIYLLSDGAPYKKVGNPGEEQRRFAQELIDEILEFVRVENRFRGVVINTYGMDGPGVWHKKWPQPRPVTLPTEPEWLAVLSNFMRELAQITGGEYTSI